MITIIIISLISIFYLLSICSAKETEITIKTKIGTLTGIENKESNYMFFKGIKYANAERFGNPIRAKPLSSPYNATYYRSGCPQNCYEFSRFMCDDQKYSEDCLFLNIFRPATNDSNLSVMVYIPGGEFMQGSGSIRHYDSTYIASRGNVVVVTVNYRVGALGFLVTPNALRGNFGIKDQKEALKWVQDNIEDFGGNKDQVTVFGISAGATSIATHLVSPNSDGLFHQAVMESNPVLLPLKEIGDASEDGKVYLDFLGCEDSLECLKSKSVDEILKAQSDLKNDYLNSFFHLLEIFYPFCPVIDGVEVGNNPLFAFQEGKFNHMPMMIGSTTNEALAYIFMAANFSVDEFAYYVVANVVFGLDDGEKILALYTSVPLHEDKRYDLGILGSDYVFKCPTRNITEMISGYQSENIWLYEFAHHISFNFWSNKTKECNGYACHSCEEPFLFHYSTTFDGVFNFTKEEEILSNNMIDMWTSFAKHSDPNKGSSIDVDWTPYNSSSHRMIKIDYPLSMEEDFNREKYCSVFDSTVGYHHGY